MLYARRFPPGRRLLNDIRELGVRYLLEGSVRRAEHEVRVTAQLIDAETGAHLWAERFDRSAADLLTLQAEVTGQIARMLNLQLMEALAVLQQPQPDMTIARNKEDRGYRIANPAFHRLIERYLDGLHKAGLPE